MRGRPPPRRATFRSPMKIATWNVNSIRARQARVLAWLEQSQPDALLLQEVKCQEKEFPSDALRALGYHSAVHGQKTYNGVAIVSKAEPLEVERGINDGVEEPQSRVIAATVAGVRVVSVYAPNGQAVGSPAYVQKLEFYERLRSYLDKRHRREDALVLGGDWNVAPEDIDVWDPVAWEGQTLFTLPEREALKKLCAFGLEDTFRRVHPALQKFSWWDYRMLAFPKNRGLRIDHVYATPALAARCVATEVDREARKGPQPSDHAPVWAEFRP